MWKKSDPRESRETPRESTREEPTLEPPTETPRGPAPKRTREPGMIGPSITIRGDVTGDEDLLVQGRVEGTIKLPQNNVTVGGEGHIKADVHAKVLEIQGHVEGDLRGEEQVIIRRSARVQGNLTASRVTLEDGCKFRGSIEMEMEERQDKPREGGGERGVAERANVSDIKPSAGAASEDPGKGGVSRPGQLSGR